MDFIFILFDFVAVVGADEDVILSACCGGAGNGHSPSLGVSTGLLGIDLDCCRRGLLRGVEGRTTSVASPAANGAEPSLRIADTGGPRMLVLEDLRIAGPLFTITESSVATPWHRPLLAGAQRRG